MSHFELQSAELIRWPLQKIPNDITTPLNHSSDNLQSIIFHGTYHIDKWATVLLWFVIDWNYSRLLHGKLINGISYYFQFISIDVASNATAKVVQIINTKLKGLRLSEIRRFKDYAKAFVIRLCLNIRVLIYCSVQSACDKIVMALMRRYFQSLFCVSFYLQLFMFICNDILQRVNIVKRIRLMIRFKKNVE